MTLPSPKGSAGIITKLQYLAVLPDFTGNNRLLVVEQNFHTFHFDLVSGIDLNTLRISVNMRTEMNENALATCQFQADARYLSIFCINIFYRNYFSDHDFRLRGVIFFMPPKWLYLSRCADL